MLNVSDFDFRSFRLKLFANIFKLEISKQLPPLVKLSHSKPTPLKKREIFLHIFNGWGFTTNYPVVH